VCGSRRCRNDAFVSPVLRTAHGISSRLTALAGATTITSFEVTPCSNHSSQSSSWESFSSSTPLPQPAPAPTRATRARIASIAFIARRRVGSAGCASEAHIAAIGVVSLGVANASRQSLSRLRRRASSTRRMDGPERDFRRWQIRRMRLWSKDQTGRWVGADLCRLGTL
jgi:hypothetical protein